MKITKVDIIPFGIPIRKFADAYAQFDTSNAVLVKIYVDDGTVGFGEACAWEPEFYGETLESVTSSIQKYLAPRLIGQNPLDISRLMSIADSILAKSTCAKEGIDLALFDLAGRILKVPVYVLLNGCHRDSVPAACEIGISQPDVVVENAEELVKMGVKILKIKCSPNIDEDVKRVKAVSEALGDEIALRLDPNAHWNVDGTIRAMRELRGCNIQYLEQPLPAWDLSGMNEIRRRIDVPLMADESVWSPQDVVELAKHEAADIVNIKIAKTCGLFQAKRVEAAADAVGLPCVVGTEIEPGISLAAKLQLAASMKHLRFACEYTELFLLKESVLRPEIEMRNGYVKVPKGVGL